MVTFEMQMSTIQILVSGVFVFVGCCLLLLLLLPFFVLCCSTCLQGDTPTVRLIDGVWGAFTHTRPGTLCDYQTNPNIVPL